MYTKSRHSNLWKKFKQLHPQGGVATQGTIFVYECTALSLPPNAARATAVCHTNRNQICLTGWHTNTPLHTPSLQEQDIVNMRWMNTSTLPNPNTAYIIDQLRHNQTIPAVSDGSYHPTYKLGTSG